MRNERHLPFNSSFIIPHSSFPFNTCHAHVFCGTNTARSLEEFASGVTPGAAEACQSLKTIFKFPLSPRGHASTPARRRGAFVRRRAKGVPSIFDL
jgi:hypothetical protein